MKYQIEHESIKDYQPDLDKISLYSLEDLPDHSIEYINSYNMLEVVPDYNKFLELMLSKLRLKGVMVIIGIDLNKLCELYLDQIIDAQEFNDFTSKKTIYPLSKITNALIDNKFTLITIKTDRLLYYIECKRSSNE